MYYIYLCTHGNIYIYIFIYLCTHLCSSSPAGGGASWTWSTSRRFGQRQQAMLMANGQWQQHSAPHGDKRITCNCTLRAKEGHMTAGR